MGELETHNIHMCCTPTTIKINNNYVLLLCFENVLTSVCLMY